MRRLSFTNMFSTATGSSKAEKPAVKETKPTVAFKSPAPQPKKDPAVRWKVARDPKTGRTYYYDVVTRKTQWNKPVELQPPEERQAKEKEKEAQKSFFAEMERNMRKNFEEGHLSTDVIEPKSFQGLGWKPPPARESSIGGGDRAIRTLSTIDDSMLEDAYADDTDRTSLHNMADEAKGGHHRRSNSDYTSVSSGFQPQRRRRSLSPRSKAWSLELEGVREAAKKEKKDGTKPGVIKEDEASSGAASPGAGGQQEDPSGGGDDDPARPARNSTGTMFVDHTLAAPDKDATIRCVCHVLRAHMAAADAAPRGRAESASRQGEFAIFEDDDYAGDASNPALPTAHALTAFYRDVFSRGQMELECIVTSLIYVERLLRACRGRVKLRASNWRPILFAAMVMASKVCDDLSMWNADFGHICRGFDLHRINALEAALLRAYGFNATVTASEYAKYYFHLRSMCARLGLGGDFVLALDVAAARDVAARSRAQYGQVSKAGLLDPTPLARRAVSLGGAAAHKQTQKRVIATLEQVVDMAPIQASPRV